MKAPIVVDLYAGLGGWSEGFIANGYTCIGFDITRHQYGDQKYPGQLVIQDVLTLHGSQFKDADCIVASPPCQDYSYLAMPWSRSVDIVRPCGDGWEILNSAAAKEMRAEWEHEGPDNRLFDACFRIQREAIEARSVAVGCGCREMTVFQPVKEVHWSLSCARCFIPLIVENVRGAIPWVGKRHVTDAEWFAASEGKRARLGRSAWNYGSFHLWADVPALMPVNLKRGSKVPGFRFDGSGRSFQTASVEATGAKNTGGSWFNIGSPNQKVTNQNPVHELSLVDGTKIGGDWFSDPKSTCRKHGSRSQARKAASAQIAKIPFPLADHIARTFKPRVEAVA